MAIVIVLAGCAGDDDEAPDAGLAPTPTWDVPSWDSGTDAGDSTDARSDPPAQTCLAPAPPWRPVVLRPAFTNLPGLVQPVAMAQAPGDPSRWFAVELTGRIQTFANSPAASTVTTFLDISDQVETNGDAGLVGLAIHPTFQTSGQVFVAYTAIGGTIMLSRLSRFVSTDGGVTADPSTEEVLIEIDQDWEERTHLSCDVQFGPDGYLYVAFGDGGPHGDPFGRAQDPNQLRGKVLRLDPDGGSPYGVPASNPFAAGGGAPEVYALGFRNPWRMRFDTISGELWGGDVGWDTREEINRITLGGNYGWPFLEGTFCDEAGACESPPGLTPPVVDYGHDEGQSATGGAVYRGAALPSLYGRYVFADYGRGYIWALDSDAGPGTGSGREVVVDSGLPLVAVAEDENGELLFLDVEEGTILRLEPNASAPGAPFPALLSATGCTAPGDATEMAPSVIPYEINAPAWVNGAESRRWLALPDGARATVDEEGALLLPPGAITLTEKRRAGRRLETRLRVYHPGDGWAGYLYRWNADQTDATLLPLDSKPQIESLGGEPWMFSTRSDCRSCHPKGAGDGNSLQLSQLRRTTVLPNGHPTEQLTWLSEMGVLELAPADRLVAAMPSPWDSTQPLEERARAWLHANCANCHRPGGPSNHEFDLRFSTPLADTQTCGVAPEHGHEAAPDHPHDTLLIAPGAPAQSELLVRIDSLDADAMPPLGKVLIDGEGAELISAWIAAMPSCP